MDKLSFHLTVELLMELGFSKNKARQCIKDIKRWAKEKA